MNIALIAHDKKKGQIVKFAVKYKEKLKKCNLFSTGTTGKRIVDATQLDIRRFMSGPIGGDQQIGSKIAKDELDLVIFLRDPLTAQPHEPDVQALLRLCDVHHIPLATNIVSAELLMTILDQENIWRKLKKEYN
ncbi:MAG: methylglyoxal synthase [Bacillota bacterium]